MINPVTRVGTSFTAVVITLLLTAPVMANKLRSTGRYLRDLGEQRLDLPLDLVGGWERVTVDNCEGFVASLMVYGGIAPSLDFIIPRKWWHDEIANTCAGFQLVGGVVYQYQDCLKLTITDSNVVHHMVLDDEYVADDYYFDIPFAWTSRIEEPMPDEVDDCATATLVNYQYNTTTMEIIAPSEGTTRRYINCNGELVLTQDLLAETVLLPNGETMTTKQTITYQKVDDLVQCTPYAPDDPICEGRVYTDEADSWTLSCCENYGGNGFLEDIVTYPRPEAYMNQTALGLQPCPGS